MADRKKPFAKRSLGQNFLADQGVVRRIADSLAVVPGERVVEIGAGRGALTAELLERGAEVHAIEFDRDLVPVLRERFADNTHFHLIEDDALNVDFAVISGGKGKLAANLPYNISTAILQRLMDTASSFTLLVLMFQREVAERITAAPGGKDRGYLSVLAQRYFDIERLFDVPGSAFRPVPKVWSSVIRLIPRPVREDTDEIRELAGIAFAQKRKTILNNLKNEYPFAAELLEDAAIDPQRRAETLSGDEWETLAHSLKKFK